MSTRPSAGPVAVRPWPVVDFWDEDHPLLPAPDEDLVMSTEPSIPAPDRTLIIAFTRAMTEVLRGIRPAGQLGPVVSPRVLHLLERESRTLSRHAGIRLHSVRIQAPSTGVLEVAARIGVASSSRAASLRWENRMGRWICTRFECALSSSVIVRSG